MKKEPLISVIIPVYNSEKHLRKCLDSICFQTYKNLEIICINDGSKDRSGKILKEYAQKDSRIVVFEQRNQGQSSARNKGIICANGDYVTFIDSDDRISLSTYQKFIDTIHSAGIEPDVYMFNGVIYSGSSNLPVRFFDIKKWQNHKENTTVHTFDDCMSPFSGNTSVCNKIYKKEFLKANSFLFPENLIY